MGRFFRRALELMAAHPWLHAAFWATIVLQLVYKLGLALCFRTIFDDGINGGNGRILMEALGALVLLLVIFGVASLVQEEIVAQLATRIANRMRRRLFAKFLSVSPSFHRQNSPSALLDGMGNDIGAVELALVPAAPTVLPHRAVVRSSIAMLL